MASSGVIFTLDTESGFRDVVTITGSYGLGELVVQGVVTPDEWLVFKPTLLTDTNRSSADVSVRRKSGSFMRPARVLPAVRRPRRKIVRITA